MTYDDARGLLGTDLLHISDFADQACLCPSNTYTFPRCQRHSCSPQSRPYQTLGDEHYKGISAADIPDAFDATTHWKGLIHPIRDQQRCGSCWAFSATEVLSDRASIKAGKSTPVKQYPDVSFVQTQP